jgi:hypothetical protein
MMNCGFRIADCGLNGKRLMRFCISIRNPQSAIRNLLLLATCLALPGCNLVGAGGVLAHKVLGPSAVDPVYTLGPEPVVVVVENFRNPVGAMADAEEVTAMVIKDLRENLKADKDDPPKVNVIDQEKLIELQNGRPSEYGRMKIPQIGKAVGAKQVLYVDLITSGVEITPGSDLLRGRFFARVKVIDVATGQTKFPTDVPDGVPVSWGTKPQRITDRVYPAAVRVRALRVGSNYVSRLFYKWKPEDQPDDDAMQAVPEL